MEQITPGNINMNNSVSPSSTGQPRKPFNAKLVAMIVGAAVLVGAGVFAAMYPWGVDVIDDRYNTPASTQPTSQSAISIVSVSVLSPSGVSPKSLVIGDTATIKWQSQGVEKVDIGYRREGSGAEFISIATAITATVGSYSWAIPLSALPAEFTSDSLKFIVAQSPNQCGAGNCGVSDTSDMFSIVSNSSAVDIIDAARYNVDDFLSKNNSLAPGVVNIIKKITLYDMRADAQGKSFATINIVSDGADKDIIYFADSEISGREFVVYRLNVKTNKLDIIYRHNPDIFNFHLIARQKNKLLFLKIDQMDSPGPCWGNGWVYVYENPWPRPKSVNDTRTIQSLDLNNPAAGLSLFAIPQEKYNSEKVKEKSCLQELQAQ